MVRRLVEDEEVRAGRDDQRERRADDARRPRAASTRFSWSSQPEKRKRPRSACACGRCRPVAPIVHSSTLPRSSSSTSCWEKYASSTPWPIRPSSAGRRSPRAASTCRSRSARSERHARRARGRARRPRAAASCPAARSKPSASIDHPAAPGRLQELEAERPPAGARRLDALGLDPGDLLQLRLRLPRLRAVAEAGDEALEPGDVLRLALAPTSPGWRAARPSPGARRATCRGRRSELPPSSSSTEVATDSRNQRSCATRMTAASIVASSCSSHSIEAMSRWLVGSSSRSRSGPPGERARERGACQLSAGEGLEPAVEVAVGEAEAAQHGTLRGRASRSRPRARAAPAPRRSAGASRARGRRAAIASSSRRSSRSVSIRSDAPERAYSRSVKPPSLRRPLVVQRHAGALLPGELAARELGLAHQGAQQRRLAGAVRAGEREPVAALELERDAVEERLAGELLPERGCDQDCHALRVVRG